MELSKENQAIRDHHIKTFNAAAKKAKRKYRAIIAPKDEVINGMQVDMIIQMPDGYVISKWHVLGWVPGVSDAQIVNLWETAVPAK